MKKITKFYISKAKYRAEDNSGNVIWVEIDYWANTYKMSGVNKKLEQITQDLLKRKHRVNFVRKLLQ